MQPHGIEVGLTLELVKKRKKIKSDKSSFQAMIEIEDDKKRGKLVLPMRSFNKLMLEWLRQMLAGTPIGTYVSGATSGITIPARIKKILNASTVSTQATNRGIVLGASASDYLEPSAIALKGLIPNATNATTAGRLTYLPMTLEQIINVSNKWGFIVKRVIQNNTGGGILANVMALRAQDVSSASVYDIALDPFYPSPADGNNGSFYFDGLSAATFSFNFYIESETLTVGSGGLGGGLVITLGGLTRNFTSLMLNLLFQGSTSFILPKYTGEDKLYTISKGDGASNASNMLNLMPSTPTTKEKGIVALYNVADLGDPNQVITPSFPANVVTIGANTGFPNLTAGTNFVSPIEISGNTVSFTVHRDFTNDTNGSINITRVGIITGASGNNAELLLAQNRVYKNVIEHPVTVPKGETLRVSYKFTTVM